LAKERGGERRGRNVATSKEGKETTEGKNISSGVIWRKGTDAAYVIRGVGNSDKVRRGIIDQKSVTS